MTEVFCSCGKRFLAKPEHVGRWAQCPACRQRFVLAPQLEPGDLIEIVAPTIPESRSRAWLSIMLPTLALGLMDLVLIFVVISVYVSRTNLAPHIAIQVAPLEHTLPKTTRRPATFPAMPDTSFRPHPKHRFDFGPPSSIVAKLDETTRDALRNSIDLEESDEARVKKAIIKENERLRQEWIASGKPEKQGEMIYLSDRIAQVMRNEQDEVLRSARHGDPKPALGSRLGRALTRYIDPNSDLYNEVFVEILKTVAPAWLSE